MSVRFLLNGKALEVAEDSLEGPHQSLLSFLRARGLTGAKEGCAEGECGACAVALVVGVVGVVGDGAQGTLRFAPVNACLLPVSALHERALVSVEGIADPGGALHVVQQTLADAGGSQCGYCTPGFVVSLFSEYYRPDRAGYDPEGISGNLCRCTGYRPIIAAAQTLFAAESAPAGREDATKRRLLVLPAQSPEPGPARYLQPQNLAELFSALAAHPDATLIHGGTDLMVEANLHARRFERFISLESVAELTRFSRDDHALYLGAGLSLSALSQKPHGLALLDQLLPLFASRLIRNRATLGGNLATASPIGDAAPVLLALEAELELASVRGTRRVPLDHFFTGYRQTLREPDEVIAGVVVPLPAARLQRFYKVSKRPLDDISSVAAAFALDLDARGNIERLRIAYGGLAATPVRAHAAEQRALGEPLNDSTLRALSAELTALGTPLSDHRASAAYRAAMRDQLLAKFFREARAELEP